nr:hypothetical protein Iba_chr06bCG3590 [Ipomoea batatas]
MWRWGRMERCLWCRLWNIGRSRWSVARCWLLNICIVHYQPNFSCISASLCLEWPRAIIIAFRENSVEYNPKTTNEIVVGNCIAIPDNNIQLPQAFNH